MCHGTLPGEGVSERPIFLKVEIDFIFSCALLCGRRRRSKMSTKIGFDA